MIKDLVTDIEQLSKRSKEWDVRGNQQLAIELVQNLDDTLENNKDLMQEISEIEQSLTLPKIKKKVK